MIQYMQNSMWHSDIHLPPLCPLVGMSIPSRGYSKSSWTSGCYVTSVIGVPRVMNVDFYIVIYLVITAVVLIIIKICFNAAGWNFNSFLQMSGGLENQWYGGTPFGIIKQKAISPECFLLNIFWPAVWHYLLKPFKHRWTCSALCDCNTISRIHVHNTS